MKKEIMKINVNDNIYNIHLNKKKIKKIIIKVDPMNKITMNYPSTCSKERALKHLTDNFDWVIKTLDIQRNRFKGMDIEGCFNYEKIWILGKLYKIIYNKNLQENYLIENDVISIKGKLLKTIKLIQEQACKEILIEFDKFSQSFDKHIKQKPYLEFRDMRSRWGSCNYRSGKIVLNKKLFHVPIELIRYVIIHEFVHFIYPNHSKDFYGLLNQFIPDYRLFEKDLKKYSFYLTF